jgi:hypothetical protein
MGARALRAVYRFGAVKTTKRSLPHRVSVSALPGIGTIKRRTSAGLARAGRTCQRIAV